MVVKTDFLPRRLEARLLDVNVGVEQDIDMIHSDAWYIEICTYVTYAIIRCYTYLCVFMCKDERWITLVSCCIYGITL